MKKYKILAALFLAFAPALSVNGFIIYLPQMHGSAHFHHAVELMEFNNHDQEVASLAEKFRNCGMDEDVALVQASMEIMAREEAIRSQFKIYHHLKMLALANPEIVVGEEGSFFNAQSPGRGFLVLGPHVFRMPTTYMDYLALRGVYPEKVPRFFNANEQPLENASPFGIMGMRYSFGNLDFLRNQNIEISDQYEQLSFAAKFYLARAGGLSIAVSQGIIRNVIAIEDAQQEIHRYHRKVPLSSMEKDAKDLGKLRVYAHYLGEFLKFKSKFMKRKKEMDELRERYIQNPWQVRPKARWFGAHVNLRMAGLGLLEVMGIFEPRFGPDLWREIVGAFAKLCTGSINDEDENIDYLIDQIDYALFQLNIDFTGKMAYELFDGREQVVLSRIKEALGKADASKDFVLIYGWGNNFLRHSSDELPVGIPQEFWLNQGRDNL